MGRPINYKKLGGELSQDGEQLLFRAFFTEGGAEENAYLVKQVGVDKFRLAAVSDSAMVEDFTLGETAVQGSTAVLNVTNFNTKYEITSLTVTNTPIIADGNYTATLEGGDPVTAATITVTVASSAITNVEVDTGGAYPTDISGVTLSAIVAGETVEFTATTATIAEKARKITQHRVYTFEGNAYKYEIDDSADSTGEADVATE